MSTKKTPAKNALAKKPTAINVAAKATESESPASGPQKLQNEVGDESSQEEAKSSKVSGDTLSLSPDRLKIVELATQMVVAQITASASYQIALGLARVQCDMIKDLSKPHLSEDVTDREDTFRRIAGYSMISIRKPRELKPLGFSEFDELFESAMYRAQRMLRAPKEDKRVVHAEQLFEHMEVLTESMIVDRFLTYKWPTLTSRKSGTKMMANVDSLFSSHFKFLNTPGSHAEISHRIEQCNKQYQEEIEILVPALELCRKNSGNRFDSHQKRFLVAAHSIENLITARRDEGYENVLPPISSDRHRKLILRMFNDSEPRPREQHDVEGSPSETKKSPPRIYWPWGVFRYLRLHGNTYPSFDGKALNLKLKTERSQLNPEEIPNIARVESEEYDFGPLGASVDDSDPLLEEGGAEDEMYYSVHGSPNPLIQSEVE